MEGAHNTILDTSSGLRGPDVFGINEKASTAGGSDGNDNVDVAIVGEAPGDSTIGRRLDGPVCE